MLPNSSHDWTNIGGQGWVLVAAPDAILSTSRSHGYSIVCISRKSRLAWHTLGSLLPSA